MKHTVYKWGSDFRPTYARVHELRALIPSGTPMVAATATVTKISLPIILQQLNIVDYKLVYVPPERPNIYLEVRNRTTIEEDFAAMISDLKLNLINTKRVLVYCQSLNMCSSLYAHFLYALGDSSYYPPGAPKLAENRLFGMYHSGTADHNKDVIIKSMTDPNGVVKSCFCHCRPWYGGPFGCFKLCYSLWCTTQPGQLFSRVW